MLCILDRCGRRRGLSRRKREERERVKDKAPVLEPVFTGVRRSPKAPRSAVAEPDIAEFVLNTHPCPLQVQFGLEKVGPLHSKRGAWSLYLPFMGIPSPLIASLCGLALVFYPWNGRPAHLNQVSSPDASTAHLSTQRDLIHSQQTTLHTLPLQANSHQQMIMHVPPICSLQHAQLAGHLPCL